MTHLLEGQDLSGTTEPSGIRMIDHIFPQKRSFSPHFYCLLISVERQQQWKWKENISSTYATNQTNRGCDVLQNKDLLKTSLSWLWEVWVWKETFQRFYHHHVKHNWNHIWFCCCFEVILEFRLDDSLTRQTTFYNLSQSCGPVLVSTQPQRGQNVNSERQLV